ncbi:phosphatidylserine/phosphatidylglycerophosphate/cardiolipin synthase family protein [uncultured Cellulomonas sp.]|uniref:phospholipase D-like domain-containing protein n=1 Tax=uncultured Cellulomonas sp. TaxID=189682 RepID=UPI00261E31D6|nr:phospholipase D-like domain-containing protein [uncultured Cellulomonas sp.]
MTDQRRPAGPGTVPRAPGDVAERPRPRQALEGLLGSFTDGNCIDVLRDGDEIFPAMLTEIAAATRSVDLLTYLWGTGRITDVMTEALCERARAGVRVRVVLDALGSHGIARAQVRALRDAGALVEFFRPLSVPRLTAKNRRSHSRVLVCDERVAFAGGTGIDEAWTGSGRTAEDWRDTSFRVRGPAVSGLRAAFATVWLQTSHPVLTEHDRLPAMPHAGDAAVNVLRVTSQHGWNEAMLALVVLLETARERVRIVTPYSRLPARLMQVVQATARRGVQVQLLLPGRDVVDHPLARLQGEHQHDALMSAGVEIWTYQPAMLHAKVVTVDGSVTLVGSANIDARSLALNLQVEMLIHDRGTVATLDAHLDEDLALSERVDLGGWRGRGLRRRAAAAALDVLGRPVRGLGSSGVVGRRR